MRRRYVRYRRAWTPRLWPMVLVCVLVIVPASALLDMTFPEAIAVGFVTGFGVAAVRWEVWKRRHPIITPAEYITELQRNARWN